MVTVFFRQKREGANSIEKVFDNIDTYLLPHSKLQVPYVRPSDGFIKNIKYAHKYKSEVNHITGEIHYVALGTGSNTVLTIHDVGSALQGNWIRNLRTKLLWFWIPAIIVKRITVISEFTKKELLRIIPFAKKKVVVIHNAFCPEIAFKEKQFCEDIPMILHIGTKSNKNLERTIESLKSIPCKLVIVGRLSNMQRLLLSENCITFENYFDIPYSDIVRLYQECDIVSFPSLYEGFGVPILEANAAGRPVIAGDIPVLHEVGANSALFVNPQDSGDIRNGFEKIIQDRDLREELVRNGFENIKRFAPQTIAEKYNAIYKELANEK